MSTQTRSPVPHAGSTPPIGSGFVQAAPAREVVVVPVRQTPAEQVWPVAQRLPQKPQFAASVCVFTHTPEHMVIGLVHVLPPVQRLLMHA